LTRAISNSLLLLCELKLTFQTATAAITTTAIPYNKKIILQMYG
jgi:hypothetical protein